MHKSLNKILIIGNGGCGKSTMAVKLGQKLNISTVIHLDKYYWGKGWQPLKARDKDFLESEAQKDRWIIECSKLDGIMSLIDLAETIVILNLPRSLCLWRVFKRGLKHVFKRHLKEDELHVVRWFDLDAYRWIWRYPNRVLPPLLDAIQKRHEVNAIHLETKVAVAQFFQSVEHSTPHAG